MQDQAASTSKPKLAPTPGHRRHKSAAVLKSIMSSKGHKTQDSAWETPTRAFHKKTASSVSLRSHAARGEHHPDSTEPQSGSEYTRNEDGQAAPPAAPAPSTRLPQKAKSSTNLAAMFSKCRNKDRQPSPATERRDKENSTPSSSEAPNAHLAPTLPCTGFSSVAQATTTTKVHLNDRWLPQKPSVKNQRPKSMVVTQTSPATSLFDTLCRKKSGERVPLSDTKGNESRQRASSPNKKTPARPVPRRASTSRSAKDQQSMPPIGSPIVTKKPNKVMAAVAAFNGKAKQQPVSSPIYTTKLDPNVVDAEFEAVLESRNIPTHQRGRMRTLKLEVKADFVRMHKLDTPQVSGAASSHSPLTQHPNAPPSGYSKSRNTSLDEDAVTNQTLHSATSSKRERPRSKTFNFARSDSPTKKQKGELSDRKIMSKPNAIHRCPSTRSLASNASDRSVSNGVKIFKPDEFIIYLKKTLKPPDVEIGKLHKLRLLLRNETVDWVDEFIKEGGLKELVSLLFRIMEMQWREDHEDTLLHELLRCIKGLCTTATALKQLGELSAILYPALLAMLFDEEHKGPSEFTTRELIIEIIFAHISMASENELEQRAYELLKYLKDPIKEKESSTVPFILQMHQPRPYQVWCKELSNVTKEVFWIFIHNLNVIPIPNTTTSHQSTQSFAKTHFPGQRVIVPAAPYVGGVEWDATNYLATHMDLLNGIIASLPSPAARNSLRQELKISGFEKLMGHIRACNPKYYGAVHDSIKVWVGAALADNWDVKTVRMGAVEGKGIPSPIKQSPKKKVEAPPQLQAPKIDIALEIGFEREIATGHLGTKNMDWL